MNKSYWLSIFLLSSSLASAQTASEAGADLAKNPRLLDQSANLSNPAKQKKLSEKAAIVHKKRTQEIVRTEETAKTTPSFPIEESSEVVEEQKRNSEPKTETEKKRPRLKRPAAQLELYRKEKERLRKPDLAEVKKPEAKNLSAHIEAVEELANIDDEFFEENLD